MFATTLCIVAFVLSAFVAFAFPTFVVLIASTTATSAATTTSAGQLFDKVHHLVVGGFARLHNGSFEVEALACPRVVQVNRHLLVVDVHHDSVEVLPLLVLQGDDGAHEAVLVVELAVDEERLAWNLSHSLVDVFAESLLWSQCEIEGVARLQRVDVVFEFLVRNAESADERERLLGRHLLLLVGCSVLVDGEQLVGHSDEFVGLLFHCRM